MEFGKIEYIVVASDGGGAAAQRTVRLTLIGQGDGDVLQSEGLSALRRRRILRLAHEAAKQGAMLAYGDLSGLLFTSIATLKRDIKCLESSGDRVPIKGRRRTSGEGGGRPASGYEGARG